MPTVSVYLSGDVQEGLARFAKMEAKTVPIFIARLCRDFVVERTKIEEKGHGRK